jgi:indole-3-glycerol phosphate synthase
MNILTSIVAKKTEKLHVAKVSLPQSELEERIKRITKPRDFKGAIQRHEGPIRLIAEIKKASPSKGLIRSDFDPLKIASIYESKPVSALSVLTEEDYFQGQLSYISQVKDITTKPILRKDFIFDEYQLYESRASGADAVLLIAAVLEQSQAKEYLHLAAELGLTVLFEVHNEEDLEKALRVDAEIIGINNRNLKTLSIDLSTTLRLKKEVPAGKIVVSESGISTRKDVLMLQDNGIDAMLIGTSFMETPDIGRKIDDLLLS